MAHVLEEALRLDLGCSHGEAQILAERARERRSALGAEEDTDEDLIVRLRDPAVFGTFARGILSDGRVPAALRQRTAEHAFDLIPLPRSEGDVFLVDGRVPRDLLVLAAFLDDRETFTVLHAMHLLYAVFLDRTLFTVADRAVRVSVLTAILGSADAPETLRVLYGALHLASVPEGEARRTLLRLLRARSLSPGLRRRLGQLVATEDGGVAALAELAREEGLLPEDADTSDSPALLANIPRLPRSLVSAAQAWVARNPP